MVVIDALQSVLSIIIMASIGYFLCSKRWLSDKSSHLFSKLIVNISLPAVMIYNLMTSFTKEELLETLGGVIVPFFAVLITYMISVPLGRLLKIREDRRGIFSALITFANTIFIGLPVNVALFGEGSIPYVTLYYIANTTVFWTIGVYGIRRDGETGRSKNSVNKLISFSTLRRIFSPI
ncbi:MAG: AEC family transporter, partial [Halanaerobiales bacterium]